MGLTEDPARWVRWLSVCIYVGVVEGRNAAEILEVLGLQGRALISGDSALLSTASQGVMRQRKDRIAGLDQGRAVGWFAGTWWLLSLMQ